MPSAFHDPPSISTGILSSSTMTASTIFVFRSMKSGQSSRVRSITRDVSFFATSFFFENDFSVTSASLKYSEADEEGVVTGTAGALGSLNPLKLLSEGTACSPLLIFRIASRRCITPLLGFDLPPALSLTQDLSMLTTNGSIWSPVAARYLIKSWFDLIFVLSGAYR